MVLVRTGTALGNAGSAGSAGSAGGAAAAAAAPGVVALTVDAVVDARELILQDVGGLLGRARGVVGGAVRPDGRPLFLLDPEQLARGAGEALGRQAAAALRRRAAVQRKRVLVVDDAISVRKAVAQLLTDAGYEAQLARDGFDALQQWRSDAEAAAGDATAPALQLVITDLEMPNLNGLDLVRHLRRAEAEREAARAASRSGAGQPPRPALPVIMITSRATEKHREVALAAGVSCYLTKPYTDAELLAQVRRLLAG